MSRIYGEWAGNPKGFKERLEDCIVEVADPRGFLRGQCSRKRGHGSGGLYCKQHAKMKEAGRKLYEGTLKDQNDVLYGD